MAMRYRRTTNEIYRSRKGGVLMIQEEQCFWLKENLIGTPSVVKPYLVRKFKNIFTLIGKNLDVTKGQTTY